MPNQNQTKIYTEQGGAKQVVLSGGEIEVQSGAELDLQGTLKVAGVDLTAQMVFKVVNTVTLAEVNAGKTILPAITGKSYRIVGGYLKSTGAFAALTSIDIEDTNGTPVTVASYAQAQLTDGAEFDLWSTVSGQTKGAGWLAALTLSKGVRVIKKGSDGTTATNVIVCLIYSIE